MAQIHALQRRVEVAQQGLALFEEEARGTGARLSDAFGRIEDVLREKDFQLVRREIEVQRLTRESAQARLLLETLLETLEQRRLPSLKGVIEEFERKLAASSALSHDGEPPAEAGPGEPRSEAEPRPEPEFAAAEPEPVVDAAEAPSSADPIPTEAGALVPALENQAPAATIPEEPRAPIAAFADPAGDMTVTFPLAAAPEPIAAPPVIVQAFAREHAAAAPSPIVLHAEVSPDPNDELIADARAQLRTRMGRGAAARLMDEEQRRFAYKVWLGPIMIGVGCLGPLALVLARIAH